MKTLFYFKDCCSDRACYVFETFEQAFAWAQKATTWNTKRIKDEIQIAEIDNNDGFMIWHHI